MRKIILKRLFCFVLCMLLCLSTTIPGVLAGELQISATMNRSTGEITISGTGEPEESIGISVVDSGGRIIFLGEPKTDGNGNFELRFKPDDYVLPGDLSITAGAKNSQPKEIVLKDYLDPTKKDGKDILSFSINGNVGNISGTTVTVIMPYDWDLTRLAPVFVLSEGATAYVDDVKQISGQSRLDFTNPVIYTIKAENNSVKQYTVIVKNDTEPKYSSPSKGGSSGKGGSTGSISTPPASTTQPVQPQKMFDDIDHVPWAVPYIETLANMGVINGVGDRKFEPDRNVTREEFAKMLIHALGFEYSTATVDFYDVPTGVWYYRYVAAASREGIIYGIDKENFGVGQNITREDMATMAYRAAKAAGITLEKVMPPVEFSDSHMISEYARESVSAMQQANIINGLGDGRFAPKEFATRVQAAKIICMLYQKK